MAQSKSANGNVIGVECQRFLGSSPSRPTSLDRLLIIVLLTAPSLRSDNSTNLARTFQGAAPARPKGGDMVDIRGWLLSLVIGLGFWAFVSACLSVLIQ